METIILSGEKAIQEGARAIKNGDIVVFPTETVYGLGASAFDIGAIRQIYDAKGRPSDNPLIVHVYKKEQIYSLAVDISAEAQKVIDNFMPGPITIILKKSELIDRCITAGLDTVGIRMPSSEIARKFIAACGVPIVAPSANTSTHISPTTAKHVYDDMKGRVHIIIDGGDSDVGIESTIVDLTTDIPTILRPGAITSQMLADVLGQVATFKGEVIVAKAPGMKYKHYAPNCNMVVGATIDAIVSHYDSCIKEGLHPIVLCKSEFAQFLKGKKYIDLGATAEEITHNIYSAMHKGEEQADYIICQDLGTEEKLLSVMNRVNKASAGKRI